MLMEMVPLITKTDEAAPTEYEPIFKTGLQGCCIELKKRPDVSTPKLARLLKQSDSGIFQVLSINTGNALSHSNNQK